MQHATGWCVVDVLLDSRDQLDAELLQGGNHDRVVQPVSSEAAEHVDDYVAHVGVFAQVGDHLLEFLALIDSAGASSWIDELGDLGGSQLTPSFFNLFALGRD
nr:hypothetical protein [Streptomyces sp. NA02950]